MLRSLLQRKMEEIGRIEKNGLVKLPIYPATKVCIRVVWKRVFMNHFSLINRLSEC